MNHSTTRAFSGFRRSGVRFGASNGTVSCGTLSVQAPSDGDGGGGGGGDTPSDQSSSFPTSYYYAGGGALLLALLLVR